jgi:23S rRNA pseudouridine2605 synthase
MDVRVQKILSQWGVASRRQAEQLILAGRVRLNGAIAELGQKADPCIDRIEVDGVVVKPADRPEPIYLLLNKPIGVVSTCHDPWGRSTVLELLPSELQEGQGIHPVGRLDVDSTGALLLTNDGTLTFQLTHPRHQITKTYQVWVTGEPSEATLKRWRQGVILSGHETLPAQVIVLDRAQGNKTLLQISLQEGRNRQIRRVADQLGHPVIHLHRTAIGPIQLEVPGKPELAPGCYRSLNDQEVHFLQSQIALPSIRVSVEREEYSL